MDTAASEQIFHDLEQRHLLLRKEHDAVCIERDAMKGKLDTVQATADELREKWTAVQKDLQDRDHDLKQVSLYHHSSGGQHLVVVPPADLC